MIRRIPAPDEHCPYQRCIIYQRKWPGLNGRPSFRLTADPVRQKLADVTRPDVVTEGRHGNTARSLQKWRIDWVKHNDRAWHARHPQASDELLLERWRKRHASGYCWVLVIALQDPVRCMAEQRDILSGKTMRGLTSNLSDQYVSSGGIDPYAEGVDLATLTRLALEALEAGSLSTTQRRLYKSESRRARVIRYR